MPAALPPKKKSGCLKLGLIGGVIFLAVMILVTIFNNGDDVASINPVEPTVTLAQAEKSILSSREGVAYSNSEAGQALAARFSKLFKEAALEGTDAIKDSHEFITHCQLNENSALFLVHVPKLRKFDKESKERFCEIGWLIAQTVLAENGTKTNIELAVGVKGLALYQNIYFGKFDPNNLLEESQGVTSKSTDSSLLEDFFKGSSNEQ